MDTSKFKSIAKKGAMTVAEVGVITGGALLTTKFLDFNTLFKDQIAKDPTYAQKPWIKYQAPIKLVGGATAAAYVKNPWLKLLFVGVAVNGAIGTVRLATAKDDGTNFFQPIGNTDARLRQFSEMTGLPLSRRDQTYVSAPLSQRDQTYVAAFMGKPIDLMDHNITAVGNSMERGMGNPMERGTGCSSFM